MLESSSSLFSFDKEFSWSSSTSKAAEAAAATSSAAALGAAAVATSSLFRPSSFSSSRLQVVSKLC